MSIQQINQANKFIKYKIRYTISQNINADENIKAFVVGQSNARRYFDKYALDIQDTFRSMLLV